MVSDEGRNTPKMGLDQYLRPTAKKTPRSTTTSRAIMLDVHLGINERHAFPYSLMKKVSLQGKQIVIEYMPEKVCIEGVNLEPLYRALIQHRARSVRVTLDARGFQTTMTDSKEPVITKILIEDQAEEIDYK